MQTIQMEISVIQWNATAAAARIGSKIKFDSSTLALIPIDFFIESI